MDDLDVRLRPRGFRLIDLIVVIVVLAVFVGLFLSSVRKVHVPAHRNMCLNNLKQIGLAIQDYASTYQNALPYLSDAPITNRIAHPQSILFTILPYLEQDPMYKAGMSVTSTWTGAVPGGTIQFNGFVRQYVCPADSSNSTTQPTANGWVGSSYAANAQVFGNKPQLATDPLSAATWNELLSDFKINTIPDGTSNTIFIAERFALAGPSGSVTPCAWANPSAGGAALGGAVDAMGCPLQPFVGRNGPLRASVCGPATFFGSGTKADPVGAIAGDGSVAMHPLPESGIDPRLAATDGRAQSQHNAVVQVGMGDGSSRGISGKVNQVTWARAICSHDGQPLGSDW